MKTITITIKIYFLLLKLVKEHLHVLFHTKGGRFLKKLCAASVGEYNRVI